MAKFNVGDRVEATLGTGPVRATGTVEDGPSAEQRIPFTVRMALGPIVYIRTDNGDRRWAKESNVTLLRLRPYAQQYAREALLLRVILADVRNVLEDPVSFDEATQGVALGRIRDIVERAS